MRPSSPILAVGVAALLSAPIGARALDAKADFEAALVQVQKSVDAGRWKEVRSLLQSTLAEHVDQPYVRERRGDVIEMLSRCAFELAVPDRGVQGLFLGEVAAYDPKDGEIELRWERPKPRKDEEEPPFPGEDFETLPEGLVLRVPFVGAHSLELSGKAVGQKDPVLITCMDAGRRYEATLDAGSGNVIARCEGDVRKDLVMSTDIFNVARPYKLKLTVRPTQIDVALNGKRLVQAEKAKEELGRVGFRDVQRPDKIAVKGTVDKAWIAEQLRLRRAADRAKFDETHDAQAELPEWLRQG